MQFRTGRRDAGFTLIEVLMVTVLMGVLASLAVGSWRSYADAQAQSGAADEVREVLRQAQQQAVTEGTSICVDFSTSSFRRYRGACDSADRVPDGAARDLPDAVRVSEASFVTGPGITTSGVTFRSRGTASPGRIVISRDGTGSTQVVTVEGLTGRVSND